MSIDSANKLRADALARGAPRYIHIPTRHRYLVIVDDGQQCELQDIALKSIYASHEALANHEIWERIP